ncbi:MAG: endopeptidase La [Rhodothalassiaceae bacterium]
MAEDARPVPPDAPTPGGVSAAPGHAPDRGEAGLPTDARIILPVRRMVLFPGLVMPIVVGRPRSVAAAKAALDAGSELGVVMQREADISEPGWMDLHKMGTTARILRTAPAGEAGFHIICQGLARFSVRDPLQDQPYFAARIDRIEEPAERDAEIEARFLTLKEQASEALALLPDVPKELKSTVARADQPGQLADLVASSMDLESAELQEVLETVPVAERLDKVLALLAYRLEVLRVSRDIGQRAAETMGEHQREAILREQMRAIQQELGEGDAAAEEVEDLREALAKAELPEEVQTQADKELKRLERIPSASAERGMVINYLETIADLPWSVPERPPIDIDKARQILDEDHYGLDKVKRRILEYLAVRKLAPEGRSPILCFVGPPGVGKTSLGRSIARAMDRPFGRLSLGGVHDEAEIRGHRRTYIGAMPGNILQAIRKAQARDCVLMLDEIDKLGAGGFHGDPSSALLEVLDPEQNSSFRDNYLGVPFDLSRIVFITTANILDTIPGPLRDRMEVIDLVGYTEEEKVAIARRYLVSRQIKENGLTEQQVEITDAALHKLVSDYTREAGCRNLERQIAGALRHAAVRIAQGEAEHVRIDAEDLPGILGPRKFESELAMRTSVPGVATGLAWTAAGGDILFIEATRAPGSGKLILTGQLGEVMKESAQAALSLVKSRAEPLGFDIEAINKADIHIHVPAGAIPKDGPSAGVAMFLALTSLLADRCIESDLGMTGEISLRGLVLPVGGIKEKCVAAARAGLKRVLLPKRNKKDFDEIPESARNRLEFVWLDSVDDAITAALCDGVGPKRVLAEADA